MKSNIQKFRPLSAKCAGACTATFVFSSVACFIAYVSIHRDGVSQLIWLMPVSLAVLHCILVACSVFSWNSYVYLYDDSVVQAQWGKEIVISYDEISGVKIVKRVPYPTTIIISSNHRKILFDSTKENVFLEYCTNKEINTIIKTLKK